MQLLGKVVKSSLAVWWWSAVVLTLLSASAWAQSRLLTEDAFTPLHLGYAFMKSGKTDAARVHFEQVLQADRYNPYALNNLAAISESQGKLKEAMAYLLDAETNAEEYLEKTEEVCLVGGICSAIKPSANKGDKSSIAPVIHGNINQLKIKIGEEK
jgi:tetratricopeptide (TPR) repeat protein